jgi:hypothetical protein
MAHTAADYLATPLAQAGVKRIYEDEAYHFGMFTMKAVLDGRARELIDLARVNLTR